MNFDAIRFLDDYNIEYWAFGKNTQEGWVNISCVFCGDDSNHGGFNLIKGYYNCWRCGAKKIVNVVMELLSVNYYEAEKILLEYSGRSLLVANLNKRETLNADRIDIPGGKLEKMHKNYLRERNFDSDELEEKYKLRGTGIVGKWKYRIIVPIIYNKRIVSFQGRDITNKQKERYKALEIEESLIDFREILYNLDNCNEESIAVVEGVYDVFRMGDNFCAIFGSEITEHRIKLLSKYKKIFFCFDPEKEAQKKARTAAEKLSVLGCDVELVVFDENRDPADLTNLEALCFKRGLGL
jgi:DNA primase